VRDPSYLVALLRRRALPHVQQVDEALQVTVRVRVQQVDEALQARSECEQLQVTVREK
jgi:hypothetical protein